MCELCVFEDEAIFGKSPNSQIPKFYQCVIPGHRATFQPIYFKVSPFKSHFHMSQFPIMNN